MEEDRTEQSKDDYSFATNQTLVHALANRDPILIWAESGKLNGVLEDAVLAIRKAISYLRADVAMQSFDYSSIDSKRKNKTRVTDLSYEPKEVKLYLEWSDAVIKKFGSRSLVYVTNCIVEGEKCNWERFENALKLYG